MPYSVEFQLRSIYQQLSGVTPGPPGTKSTEYWLGLIYDALYGVSYSPRGGHKSKEWWLKQMRGRLLTDYGVDVLGTHSIEDILSKLQAALVVVPAPPAGQFDFSNADNSGLFMVFIH